MNKDLWELVLIDDQDREMARVLQLRSKEQAEDFAEEWNSRRDRLVDTKQRISARWKVVLVDSERRFA